MDPIITEEGNTNQKFHTVGKTNKQNKTKNHTHTLGENRPKIQLKNRKSRVQINAHKYIHKDNRIPINQSKNVLMPLLKYETLLV